jgi:hypothetical protein
MPIRNRTACVRLAHACRGVDWLIARGVSDFADAKKSDQLQFVATCLAANAVLDFLENNYEPTIEQSF